MEKQAKQTSSNPQSKKGTPSTVNATSMAQEDKISASGRWGAVHRIRLPHRNGLPLGSGGCGDQVER